MCLLQLSKDSAFYFTSLSTHLLSGIRDCVNTSNVRKNIYSVRDEDDTEILRAMEHHFR